MTAQVRLHGLLGEALAANARGRLSRFIVDETSPAIALFSPERRARNHEGDWYGEHAGKWLVAASRAAARDERLAAGVRRVADFLVSVQEPDGYLGTYAPERRFMVAQPPTPWSWNGEPSVRTWDIWTHAYLVLGLLEADRALGEPRWREAAMRIGDLCARTLEHLSIVDLGNHHGLSATVLLDPACELYFATGEARYLALAQRILAEVEAHAPLALVERALAGADASEIATGKAYQLLWNLTGLAKLHRATGEARLRAAVDALWENIRTHHLTPGGGPFGGVAHRSREVFNPAGAFSPQAYVETCSSLAWIQLNGELLRQTGEAKYAEEIERTAYNDLLGAQAPDGEDWCYYVFPNGRRVHTTYWRCCKSSGAMALEELPAHAITRVEGVPVVQVLGPAHARFDDGLEIEVRTDYPASGRLTVLANRPTRVRVRWPAWAGSPGWRHVESGTTIELPMRPRLLHAAHRNVQVSRAPDGSAVEQAVLRFDFVALARGPLAYATGLVDGYKLEETLRAAGSVSEAEPGPDAIPALTLQPPGRAPLRYEPYYRAGGRVDGAWRLTWMPLAPLEALP